jgi:hypothetical protein
VDIMWEYYDPELLNFPPGSELPRVVSYVILD